MVRGRVRDALGAVHPPAGPSPRIVSLVPSITELLFALGLGPAVVGRTTFCIHPAGAVGAVPRVGGTKKVRLDRLRALEPTHVVVNVDENDRDQVEAMRAFVPHVVVTHPDHVRLVSRIFFKRDPAVAESERPELAIFLEDGLLDGEPALFGGVELVLRRR